MTLAPVLKTCHDVIKSEATTYWHRVSLSELCGSPVGLDITVGKGG